MKKFICLLMCMLVFFPVNAFAAVISDDFATLHEETWNKYHNLSISNNGISGDYGWANPPDNTTLIMPSPQVVSTALYAVTNAQTAEFFIYSSYSTVAAVREGEYYLGITMRSDKNTLTRTRINSAKNGVYLEVNQGWQKAFVMSDGKIKFMPTLSPLRLFSKSESYGLTVLASADNESFVELPLNISNVINSTLEGADVICYYESYSCNIPENTKYIKLELRETSGFERLAGKFEDNGRYGSQRFAKVNFHGNSVKWGSFPQPKPPEPEKPPTTSALPPSSTPAESSSSESSGSTEETSSTPAESPSSESSGSTEETSSYDETSSEEETSDTTDGDLESDWTTSPSGDDPDLEKPANKPNKPERAPKADDTDEEKLPALIKKVEVKAASRVSNKSSSKAASKAVSKATSKEPKSLAEGVLPTVLPSVGQKAEGKAVPPPSDEPKRDIDEEKRMAAAGVYITGASFALAGLIRKP